MLRKDVTDWFELESDRPYMLMVANVRKYRCHAMTADEAALSYVFGIGFGAARFLDRSQL